MLLSMAERMVPAPQVEPLREAIRRFLRAAMLEGAEKERADADLAALGSLSRSMREPSATLFRYVTGRDIVHLGARLVPSIPAFGKASGLSPVRSPKPAAPVLLLHGTADNLIPAVETLHLAATLRGATSTRMLLSSALSGLDVEQPVAADLTALGSFWGDVLRR